MMVAVPSIPDQAGISTVPASLAGWGAGLSAMWADASAPGKAPETWVAPFSPDGRVQVVRDSSPKGPCGSPPPLGVGRMFGRRMRHLGRIPDNGRAETRAEAGTNLAKGRTQLDRSA